ncbi:MAG: hypothetical protein ACO23C_07940 [Prochlorococcaceae cyanobacterium]|jgi:hypothetical protein
MSQQQWLARLEAISREQPTRVLRVRGTLAAGDAGAEREPFELLIYRGFSSSTTHPTEIDPDRPVLPAGVALSGAELLAAPLNPAAEQLLAGPAAVETFLDPQRW